MCESVKAAVVCVFLEGGVCVLLDTPLFWLGEGEEGVFFSSQ